MSEKVFIEAESVDMPPGSTLAFVHGTDTATGERVSIAGDWRVLRDLRDAIEADGPQLVAAERWQVIRRYRRPATA